MTDAPDTWPSFRTHGTREADRRPVQQADDHDRGSRYQARLCRVPTMKLRRMPTSAPARSTSKRATGAPVRVIGTRASSRGTTRSIAPRRSCSSVVAARRMECPIATLPPLVL